MLPSEKYYPQENAKRSEWRSNNSVLPSASFTALAHHIPNTLSANVFSNLFPWEICKCISSGNFQIYFLCEFWNLFQDLASVIMILSGRKKCWISIEGWTLFATVHKDQLITLIYDSMFSFTPIQTFLSNENLFSNQCQIFDEM